MKITYPDKENGSQFTPEDANMIKVAVNKQIGSIVEVLPETNEDRAGEIIIFKEQRWVCNDGRFNRPLGEWWPEKGYMELTISFQLTSSGASILRLINDFSGTITPSKPPDTTGVYRFQADFGVPLGITGLVTSISSPGSFGGSAATEIYTYSISQNPPNNFLTLNVTSRQMDGTPVNVGSSNTGSVTLKRYPTGF